VPVLLVGTFFAAASSSAGIETIAAILAFVILYAVWVAYLPTLLVGLPLYLLLRGRIRLTPLSSAVGGVAVALVGVGVLFIGPALIIQGFPLGPLHALVPLLIATSALGGIAGWVFWMVLEPLRNGVR
jgi:hypothetical protein